MSFVEAANTNQQKKDPIMKSNLLSKINAMQQSKWMRPALMTLALLVTVFGLAACGHPH